MPCVWKEPCPSIQTQQLSWLHQTRCKTWCINELHEGSPKRKMISENLPVHVRSTSKYQDFLFNAMYMLYSVYRKDALIWVTWHRWNILFVFIINKYLLLFWYRQYGDIYMYIQPVYVNCHSTRIISSRYFSISILYIQKYCKQHLTCQPTLWNYKWSTVTLAYVIIK
jgi:hypothetical protein